MKKSQLTTLMLGAVLGLASCGFAQPNLNGGQGGNPGNQNGIPFGIPPGDWQKMTPEQRRAMMLNMVEQTVRGAVGFLGYQDKTVVDAVAAFTVQQEKDLEPLREKHRKVAQGLLNPALPETQVTALMEELRVVETEARQKRGNAIAELEKKIQFSKKPRLAVFLSLTGLTGEQTGFMGGFLGNVMTSMANMQADAMPPKIPGGPPAAN